MTELTRLEELITRHVTEGLSGNETMEMRRLLEAEESYDIEEFELAAAAIDLAMQPGEESIPDDVKRRLARRLESETASTAAGPTPVELPRPTEPKGARAKTVIPWLAAAAALLIAVVGWWPRGSATPELVFTDSERREQLAERPGALVREWTATGDPAGGGNAAGDVVWSAAEQRGFMRISGLAVNDPTREQYQLWIFDRDRDERYPVDGGVFDMPADTGEVLVPIEAKLEVGEPYLFAVTVEPPGGVVVSSRERIVLVAEV